MAIFTQKEQVDIIEKAMNLTATILLEQEELRKLKAEQFRSKPPRPGRQVLARAKAVQPAYPPKPISTYSFSEHFSDRIGRKLGNFFKVCFSKILSPKVLIPLAVVLVVLTVLTKGFFLILFTSSLFSVATFPIVPCLIYLVATYPGEKNRRTDALRNTDEYKKACEDAERIAKEKTARLQEEIDAKQQEIDVQYEKAWTHYNEVAIPEYNKAYSEWETNRQRKIKIFEEEIRLNTESLEAHYKVTNIVSMHYRELWILSWLYDDMSTSDHEIRYATELLDRDRQRFAQEQSTKLMTAAIGRVERTMMTGFSAVYNAIEEGNELQLDTIEQLSKTRKAVNLGTVIGTVQRHNTNKMLEELLK